MTLQTCYDRLKLEKEKLGNSKYDQEEVKICIENWEERIARKLRMPQYRHVAEKLKEAEKPKVEEVKDGKKPKG